MRRRPGARLWKDPGETAGEQAGKVVRSLAFYPEFDIIRRGREQIILEESKRMCPGCAFQTCTELIAQMHLNGIRNPCSCGGPNGNGRR